jgi:hypothetical protein
MEQYSYKAVDTPFTAHQGTNSARFAPSEPRKLCGRCITDELTLFCTFTIRRAVQAQNLPVNARQIIAIVNAQVMALSSKPRFVERPDKVKY